MTDDADRLDAGAWRSAVVLGVSRATWRRSGLVAAFVYFILLGGTPIGDVTARVLVLNILLAAPFVWIYLRSAGRDNDVVDRLALLAYLAFLVAILASDFPRQSLDVALSTLAVLAVFHFARREVHDPLSRRWLLAAMTTIALVVGVVALVTWGGRWVLWLGELGIPPPREAGFSGLIFGHRHDVALLLMLCAPAAVGWRGRIGRLLTATTLIVVASAVFLEGSRNVWLAAFLATIVAAAPFVIGQARKRGMGGPRSILAAVLVTGIVGIAAWASGLWDRMTDVSTLGARVELWSSSVDAWLLQPLTGLGPGSFPWALQFTDYFQANSFNPRHPDNALAQLLPEAGVIGLIAASLAVAAVIAGMRRAGRPDPRVLWSLAFFLFACLFANPTDFGFLILLGVAWAALATPPESRRNISRPSREFARRTRSVLASGVIVFLLAAMLGFAAIAHDEAGTAFAEGRRRDAVSTLTFATALDPGMALYWRELGVWQLEAGLLPDAASSLELATRVNPHDSVGWRAAAEVALRRGQLDAAIAAAEAAVNLNPSQATNLLTLARAESHSGDIESARDLLARALGVNPRLAGLDLPDFDLRSTTDGGLDAALAYWASGGTIPGSVYLQPAWLTGLAGREDLREAAVAVAETASGEPADRLVASLVHEALSCQWEDVGQSSEVDAALAGRASYWETRYLLERGMGSLTSTTRDLGTDMSPAIRRAQSGSSLANDLIDFSIDRWAYGRWPIFPPPIESVPPSLDYLSTQWLLDPTSVAASALPESPLAHCQG